MACSIVSGNRWRGQPAASRRPLMRDGASENGVTMGKILTLAVIAAVLEVGVPVAVWAEAAGDPAVVAAETEEIRALYEAMAAEEVDDGPVFDDAEQQAVGCAAVAAVGLAATVAAGPSEIIMLWGGGMLVPSGAAAIWVTILAQIGVSGCALGAVATPTVLWFMDQSDNISAKLSQSISW